jgi:hypothetical protein
MLTVVPVVDRYPRYHTPGCLEWRVANPGCTGCVAKALRLSGLCTKRRAKRDSIIGRQHHEVHT